MLQTPFTITNFFDRLQCKRCNSSSKAGGRRVWVFVRQAVAVLTAVSAPPSQSHLRRRRRENVCYFKEMKLIQGAAVALSDIDPPMTLRGSKGPRDFLSKVPMYSLDRDVLVQSLFPKFASFQ